MRRMPNPVCCTCGPTYLARTRSSHPTTRPLRRLRLIPSSRHLHRRHVFPANTHNLLCVESTPAAGSGGNRRCRQYVEHCQSPITTSILRLPPAGVGAHPVAAAASQSGVPVVVVLGTVPDRRQPATPPDLVLVQYCHSLYVRMRRLRRARSGPGRGECVCAD